MNIFAISANPVRCARALDDLRLNKMILECAQLLCTAINLDADPTGKTKVAAYRSSHIHNRVTQWVVKSNKHRAWVYALGIAYGEEIIYRFGRKHACHLVLEGLTFNYPYLLKYKELDPDVFLNAARHRKLGLDYTHLPTFKAYRSYLRKRWDLANREPRWTKRGEPSWR